MNAWMGLAVQLPFALGAHVLWKGAIGPLALVLSGLVCGDKGALACMKGLQVVNGILLAVVWWALLRIVSLFVGWLMSGDGSSQLQRITFACCAGWVLGVVLAGAMLLGLPSSIWLFQHLPFATALASGAIAALRPQGGEL